MERVEERSAQVVRKVENSEEIIQLKSTVNRYVTCLFQPLKVVEIHLGSCLFSELQWGCGTRHILEATCFEADLDLFIAVFLRDAVQQIEHVFVSM